MRSFIYLFLLALLPVSAQSAAEVSNWPVQQKIDFLRRITDKEKAEAAARLIQYPQFFRNTDDDINFEAEIEHLQMQHFHGSPALALALRHDEPGAALLPEPVTPEIQAELEERICRSLELVPAPLRAKVSGGPGLSRETAWIHHGYINSQWQYQSAAEYFFPESLIGGQDAMQTGWEEQQHDGRRYQITTVALMHRGRKHEVKVWIDTTNSPDEREAEAQRVNLSRADLESAQSQRNQRRLSILSSVTDRATADAAADYLQDLSSAAHDLGFDYTSLGAPPDTEESIDALKDELCAHHYYGSELLAGHLGSPHDAYKAEPLTPEIGQMLHDLFRDRLANSAYNEHRDISGGPGFTPETAWRVPASISIARIRNYNLTDDAHESMIEQLVFPDNRFEITDSRDSCTMIGKYYECWEVRVLLDGKVYQYPVWFDYSDGRDLSLNNPAPSSGGQRSETEVLHYIRTLAEVLPGITDRASAIAAARVLNAQQGELYYSHGRLLRADFVQEQIDTLPIRSELKRIRNADFFGSVDLAAILAERIGPSGHPCLIQEEE